MRKIILLLLLLLSTSYFIVAQNGGTRAVKTKSENIIHSDLMGNGDVLLLISNNGEERKLFLDNNSLFIQNDTIKTIKYILPTATTTILGGVKVDGTTVKINNGVISTFNNFAIIQSLSGTTPSYDINNGIDATITLSGNTTITMSNLVAGMKGTLYVQNASTAYTLNVSGYSNAISKTIGTINNYTKLNVTGGGKLDVFSWAYTGTLLVWNGNLDYIKQ